jgi:hypothetical protein
VRESLHRSEHVQAVDRRSCGGLGVGRYSDQACLVLFVIFAAVMVAGCVAALSHLRIIQGLAVGPPALRVGLGSSRKSSLMPSTAEIFAPLNLRCLFAIRANRPQAGETGRSGAIRPAIANTLAAVARNA